MGDLILLEASELHGFICSLLDQFVSSLIVITCVKHSIYILFQQEM